MSDFIRSNTAHQQRIIIVGERDQHHFWVKSNALSHRKNLVYMQYASMSSIYHGGRARERGLIDIIFSFGADVAIDSVRPAIGNTITAAADHL